MCNNKFHGSKIKSCWVVKNRVSYDSLSVYQWESGFITIIREETKEIKAQLLEYLSEIMDDMQDFCWSAAKGSHAVLLFCMEENKVNWQQTEKIDRIRRAHAQKISSEAQIGVGQKIRLYSNGQPCRFFKIIPVLKKVMIIGQARLCVSSVLALVKNSITLRLNVKL